MAAELHALNATAFDLDLTGFGQEEIVPCKTAGEVGDAPGTVGMRRKDGSFNAWTHGGEATQPFRIPDSVIRIERHHGAVGRHLSHPAPLPMKFAEHILRAYADEGDIVYERSAGGVRHQSHRG